MTSTHAMRMVRGSSPGRGSIRFGRLAPLLALFVLAAGGCGGPKLVEPRSLHSPYDQTQLWAVAPFANESGSLHVDPYEIADAMAAEVQHTEGLLVLPVNRVIAAMRELDLLAIATPGEAMQVMNLIGADGLIVGTVTAYDPYRPMTLGVAVELHRQEREITSRRFDTRDLTRSPSGRVSPGALDRSNPVAQAAGVFEAANHRTLSRLEEYASGRSVPDGAFGRDIYQVRMDLYAQFVSYQLLQDLLEREHLRLVSIVPESQAR